MPAPLTHRPSRRRLAGGLALVAAATALTAAPAWAGTASVVSGQLRYVANTGESNDLLIEKLSATSYRVTDEGPTMAVGAGCAINSVSKVVICSPTSITSVLVELKDQGDSASVATVTVPTTVRAGAGDDYVEGGTVKDVILGQGGRDTLRGNAGFDALTGVGNLYGGDGDDTLTAAGATGGNPTLLVGDGGNDTLNGGNGYSDRLVPGPGADDVYGGGGSEDTVSYAERTTRVVVTADGFDADDGAAGEGDYVADDVENVEGGSGNDLIEGSDQDNDLNGNSGDDVIEGYGGDDRLDGGHQISPSAAVVNDTLRGGDGNDVLVGGNGRDSLFGDTGVAGENAEGDVDVAVYSTGAAVTVTLDNVRNDGDPADQDPVAAGVQPENDLVGFDVEGVDGGSGNDTITGNAGDNVLRGGTGNDTLRGKEGSDRLVGAVEGFGGYGPQPPPPPGMPPVGDDDKLYGGTGEDVLAPGLGTDDLYGGEPAALDAASLDSVDYSDRWSQVNVSLDNVANDGAPDADGNPGNGAQPENDFVRGDVEGAVGGSARDFLTATLASQRNVLVGGSGNDMISGGPGDDLLDGGGGGMFGAGPMDAGDELRGGAGIDTVSYRDRFESISVSLDDNLANDGALGEADWVVVAGTDAVENAVGGQSNDTLKGNGGANTLQGGPGHSADQLFGRGGNDYLAGGLGPDVQQGEAGEDRLVSRGDGAADSNSCGAGLADLALYDVGLDTFPSPNDCEKLNPTTTAAASGAAATKVSVASLVRLKRAVR